MLDLRDDPTIYRLGRPTLGVPVVSLTYLTREGIDEIDHLVESVEEEAEKPPDLPPEGLPPQASLHWWRRVWLWAHALAKRLTTWGRR